MNGWAQWGTVAGLSATPALVLGQSAAAAAGIEFGLDPYLLIAVMAIASFAEGLVVAWLGGTITRVGFINRWCERMRTPKAVRFAEKWGPWGGMMLGVAALGQEPILIGLRFLGVDVKRLILPTLLSNVVYSIIYYWVVRAGFEMF